jgi:hypothetical protein
MAGTSQAEDELEIIGLNSPIQEFQFAAKMIAALKHARLDDCGMPPASIAALRDPPQDYPFDIHDADFLLSVRTFFGCSNASEETYNTFRSAYFERHPDLASEFLSFDQVKRRLLELTNISPIMTDMCEDSCAAFSGIYADSDECPICRKSRWHSDFPMRSGRRHPVRQFATIPLGPSLQAMYRSPENAAKMKYFEQRTTEILKDLRDPSRVNGHVSLWDDICSGRDILDAVQDGIIKPNDLVIQLSFDGAQLYRDKPSDCWIYVWIIHNLHPDLRYKKQYVIPGGFVGGPNPPKHYESFLFPGLYHVSALQNEGLRVWDATRKLSRPEVFGLIIALITADARALAPVVGTVGGMGKYGCRLYCEMPGRRRSEDGHYFPLMTKPNDYDVQGSEHATVTFADLKDFRTDTAARYHSNLQKLVTARNQTQLKQLRLATGLTKPTILSGLPRSLGIPTMCPIDIMHLSTLNDPDLFLGLWRGTINHYGDDHPSLWPWRVLVGKIWKAHGETVALATPFIPSSFDQAPRNPAEKINSGYKAWEFLLYIYGLGPALLRHILPHPYWQNFCRFVAGSVILQGRSLNDAQIKEGSRLLKEFVQEFEQLYVEGKEERIHFARQSIHLLTHLASEIVRLGPLASYAQWAMENVIGNLGREIRQPKDPYANLSQRGLLRAQMIAIQAMLSDKTFFNSRNKIPNSARDARDGYYLLPFVDDVEREVEPAERCAIQKIWEAEGWPNQEGWHGRVKRWSKIRLPNGQTAQSKWGEARYKQKFRCTRMVKVRSL